MAYKKIDYIQENKRLWFHKGAFLRKIKVNRKGQIIQALVYG